MSTCCGLDDSPAARHFGAARARAEWASYRRRGPGPTTRGLLDGLAAAGATGGSVLDVGAGIGGLSLQLLARGWTRATCVEMSPAFVDAGRRAAESSGVGARVTWQAGDFVALAPTLEPADLVALDRVVCCYPSAEPLLAAAAGRSRAHLALSYPRERWFVRLGVWVENLGRRLSGSPFRAVVHPVAPMEDQLGRSGFRRAQRRQSLAWNMDVYTRVAD